MQTALRLSTGLALLALLALPLTSRADPEKTPTAQANGLEKSMPSVTYLPNNSDAIITIDIRMLLDSAIAKRNLEAIKPLLKSDANFQKTVDELGLDPFKDIDTVLVGVPNGADPDKVVAVVQGRFNSKKLQARGEKAAQDNPDLVKLEKVGNDTLFKILPSTSKGEKPTYAALVDDSTLVGSRSRDLVVEALEKKAGKTKSEQKKEMKELLGKANTQQCIRIVALDAVGQGELAGLVKSLTGGLTVGEDIKIDFALNAKDDDSAKMVADKLETGLQQVQPIVGALTVQNKRLAVLKDIFDTIKIKPDGAKVAITAEVSKSVVEKIEKMAKNAQ